MGKVFNVLFLCTGNSARSILAEALVNDIAVCKGKLKGYSAGSFPKGKVHPLTLELLESSNFPIVGLRSKSWNEFSQPDAPKIDFIIAVCDNASRVSGANILRPRARFVTPLKLRKGLAARDFLRDLLAKFLRLSAGVEKAVKYKCDQIIKL